MPSSQLPEVPEAQEREWNVNTAKFLAICGRNSFRGDPPVPEMLLLGDLIPSQHVIICQMVTMKEMPNAPLTEIPRALDEEVSVKVVNSFPMMRNQSNRYHACQYLCW